MGVPFHYHMGHPGWAVLKFLHCMTRNVAFQCKLEFGPLFLARGHYVSHVFIIQLHHRQVTFSTCLFNTNHSSNRLEY
jgi:hypothetical protein